MRGHYEIEYIAHSTIQRGIQRGKLQTEAHHMATFYLLFSAFFFFFLKPLKPFSIYLRGN